MSSNGKFIEKHLPLLFSSSPVFTITNIDYDNVDGNEDVLLFCGNMNHARPRL